MKEENKFFKDWKLGQKVFDPVRGAGYIDAIKKDHHGNILSISVTFYDLLNGDILQGMTYLGDGRMSSRDITPSLYDYEVELISRPDSSYNETCDFTVDDPGQQQSIKEVVESFNNAIAPLMDRVERLEHSRINNQKRVSLAINRINLISEALKGIGDVIESYSDQYKELVNSL